MRPDYSQRRSGRTTAWGATTPPCGRLDVEGDRDAIDSTTCAARARRRGFRRPCRRLFDDAAPRRRGRLRRDHRPAAPGLLPRPSPLRPPSPPPMRSRPRLRRRPRWSRQRRPATSRVGRSSSSPPGRSARRAVVLPPRQPDRGRRRAERGAPEGGAPQRVQVEATFESGGTWDAFKQKFTLAAEAKSGRTSSSPATRTWRPGRRPATWWGSTTGSRSTSSSSPTSIRRSGRR